MLLPLLFCALSTVLALPQPPSDGSESAPPGKPPPQPGNGLTKHALIRPAHLSADARAMIPLEGEDVIDLDGTGPRKPKKTFFEGDIDLGDHTIEEYIEPKTGARKGVAFNAQRATTYKWPWGMVPYQLQWDDTPGTNADSKYLVEQAMQGIENKTCIRFYPRTTELDYLIIGNFDSGCHSHIGRQGGPQSVALSMECIWNPGQIQHELIHALGFWHEQSRADRDDYVHVIDDNIDPDKMDNFQKYTLDTISHLGAPYDYNSVMHYPHVAFSKNGKPTIMPYPDSDIFIGQRAGPSDIDIKKINTYYNCEGFDVYENHDMQTTSTATPSYEPQTVPFFF